MPQFLEYNEHEEITEFEPPPRQDNILYTDTALSFCAQVADVSTTSDDRERQRAWGVSLDRDKGGELNDPQDGDQFWQFVVPITAPDDWTGDEDPASGSDRAEDEKAGAEAADHDGRVESNDEARRPAEVPGDAEPMAEPSQERPVRDWGAHAQAVFDCVADRIGDWQHRAVAGRMTSEELVEAMRREMADDAKVDAYAFALKDGTNLVIVGRSMYGNRDRPFYKLVRSVGVQVVWKAVDIWLGVPMSILLNPPTNLVDAFFYAADLHEI
jgi:hypothetical protein